MDRLEEIIMHYEYDPVKAHEYYMRTRQLKGRSTKGMSQQQKETWAYVKDQISTEKKTNLKATTEHKDLIIKEAREKAEETRKRISEKLKKLIEDVQKKTEDSLKDIPKNVSPEKRAKLIAERKEELAKIRGEVGGEREQLRNNLKTLITSTRDAYKQAREQINTNADKRYQEEYDKIASSGKKK